MLGGDGTLIRAARELAEYEFPLIGINLGTLGFLAEVERSDFSYALERLFKNQVGFEERMMLSGEVSGNSSYQNVAVNDIVITRDGSLRIVHFDVYVNGNKQRTRVWMRNEKETYTITCNGKPQWVNIDGERSLLADVDFEKSTEELIAQYKTGALYGDRIEALKALRTLKQ